ncbi:MAG TPA: response regulator [Anaerolineales bacterium]|jgi:DNA-binding NarL/FixJ family response regulator
MTKKRALIVDDSVLQRKGVCEFVRKLGDFDIDECGYVESALQLLQTESNYSLVMVDMYLPETEAQDKDLPWTGAYLLLKISKEFRFARNLVLYTSKESPNIGDMQQVLRAGASILWGPSGVSEEELLANLSQAAKGNQIIAAAFRSIGASAADPEKQCPFDPVQYYCIRLIAEHRGKRGAATKWSEETGGISSYIVDDLLEEIYRVMELMFPDFKDLTKDNKSQRLAEWYHDQATKSYGAALPVPYETRAQRQKKYYK